MSGYTDPGELSPAADRLVLFWRLNRELKIVPTDNTASGAATEGSRPTGYLQDCGVDRNSVYVKVRE